MPFCVWRCYELFNKTLNSDGEVCGQFDAWVINKRYGCCERMLANKVKVIGQDSDYV